MRWLIVAGGTGGHLFPGIAVAEALLEEGKEVLFVSGRRKVELEILKDRPFPVERLDVEGFVGRSFSAKTRSLLKMSRAFFKAKRILKEFDPHVVLATGGYTALPVVLAARLSGKVLGLHEQNIEPGVANKLLAKWVDRVFLSIKGSERHFPKEKVVFSGNPVRRELLLVPERRKAKTHRGILFMGGSQGARFLNELALKIVPGLLKRFEELFVIHQTGLSEYERVKAGYEEVLSSELRTRLKVMPFIRDMAWAYSEVDLVVGRAGATTLAELFATKTPAVLIPFPYATHNHQEKNARVVSERGGAICLPEREASPEKALSIISGLISSPQRLEEMGEKMGSFFLKEPERVIIKTLEELLC